MQPPAKRVAIKYLLSKRNLVLLYLPPYMYCVFVSASGRAQSWDCNPSKKRLAADANSGEKASSSSSDRKENSAVRMRPFFPFDHRINATVPVVDERRSRPSRKRSTGPLKTRSKTFSPLTGASPVSGVDGSSSCCTASTAGKSLLAADNVVGKFSPPSLSSP